MKIMNTVIPYLFFLYSSSRLATVYTSTAADIKRTILRMLEVPVSISSFIIFDHDNKFLELVGCLIMNSFIVPLKAIYRLNENKSRS